MTAAQTETPWRVLVADDDDDVLEVTALALDGMQVDQRPVELLFASTEAQARAYLESHEVAVAILDVIMDTDRSGFDIAAWIRHTHRSLATRIVLRTGQPGQSDGQRAFHIGDINEFWLKTELGVGRMRATLSGLIRSYRDLVAVEEARVAGIRTAWHHARDLRALLVDPQFLAATELRSIELAHTAAGGGVASAQAAFEPLLDEDRTRLDAMATLGRNAMRHALDQPGTWYVEGPWASVALRDARGHRVLATQPAPCVTIRAAMQSLLAAYATRPPLPDS